MYAPECTSVNEYFLYIKYSGANIYIEFSLKRMILFYKSHYAFKVFKMVSKKVHKYGFLLLLSLLFIKYIEK